MHHSERRVVKVQHWERECITESDELSDLARPEDQIIVLFSGETFEMNGCWSRVLMLMLCLMLGITMFMSGVCC